MRVYTVSFSNVAVSAVQDLVSLLTGTMAIKVHEARLGQITGITVAGLSVSLKRLPATPTQGSGGSVPTPQKLNSNDAASSVVAHANDTTRGTTTGTSSLLVSDVFNIVNGWLYLPAPEDRPVVAPGQLLVLGLEGAPASALSMSGTLTYEELF